MVKPAEKKSLKDLLLAKAQQTLPKSVAQQMKESIEHKQTEPAVSAPATKLTQEQKLAMAQQEAAAQAEQIYKQQMATGKPV